MNALDRAIEKNHLDRLSRYVARKTSELSNPTTRADVEAFWLRCRAMGIRLSTMPFRVSAVCS
jgi:hypothetical protein